jgi:anti-sigma regulatory factor (Ser/Thr protein kinase)
MVRERVQRWLVDQHWPAESTADCVMAVSEAVTNSVEHGYGINIHSDDAHDGSVTVDGRLAQADHHYSAVFEVRDQGRWHAPQQGRRQYGLSIMRSCMKDVRVSTSEHGTIVSLLSRPVAPRVDGDARSKR